MSKSSYWRQFFPFFDLRQYPSGSISRDSMAALGVAFLGVPQGVAYALIAGLPPVMGLYAATIPTIIGSLMRSSRHVVTGPTNAVSLLVGATVAAHVGHDPATMAITLAFMVGVMQLVAGLMRLGSIVYYISSPVVLGYITGAGLLIAVGQLHNITATEPGTGSVPMRIYGWLTEAANLDSLSVTMALATAISILIFRRIGRRLPGAIITLGAATLLTKVFALDEAGLKVVRDLSPISGRLPPLTLPDMSMVSMLTPAAVAITVLSLVESTSVARSIAGRSGQKLNLSAEFTGEGLANLAASICGGYPTTGSLSRSALNEREGARSRLAGVFSGILVLLAILSLGPLINYTPIAALAGLLMVVAAGLIDVQHIRRVIASHLGDRLSFFATMAGTLFLHLDQAIYLGVGISIITFLRRARLLAIRDLVIDSNGRLREVSGRNRKRESHGFTQPGVRYCTHIHVLNLEGSMFFGASGELETALDDVLVNKDIQVIILRLKRIRHLDITSIDTLLRVVAQLQREGRHCLLVGMRGGNVRYLQQVGAIETLGEENLFPSQPTYWFVALEDALTRALELIQKGDTQEIDSPYGEWLQTRGVS